MASSDEPKAPLEKPGSEAAKRTLEGGSAGDPALWAGRATGGSELTDAKG